MKRAQREAFRADERARRRSHTGHDPGILSTADVARRIGVAPSTIRAYVAREQMPKPSGRFGREPFWTVETIGPWVDGVLSRRLGSAAHAPQTPEPKPDPGGSVVIGRPTPQQIADMYGVPVDMLTEHEDCRCFPPHSPP